MARYKLDVPGDGTIAITDEAGDDVGYLVFDPVRSGPNLGRLNERETAAIMDAILARLGGNGATIDSLYLNDPPEATS